MKFTKPLTALVILGASVMAPIANAQDNALQSIVSKMLTSALEVTVDELQIQTTFSVVNATHHISTETSAIVTNVKVTELAPEQASTDVAKRQFTESTKSE